MRPSRLSHRERRWRVPDEDVKFDEELEAIMAPESDGSGGDSAETDETASSQLPPVLPTVVPGSGAAPALPWYFCRGRECVPAEEPAEGLSYAQIVEYRTRWLAASRARLVALPEYAEVAALARAGGLTGEDEEPARSQAGVERVNIDLETFVLTKIHKSPKPKMESPHV